MSAQTDLPNGRKAVVVHGGARDSYQLALALSEAGLLDVLVTDLFWPADRPWARKIAALLPASLRELCLRRSAEGLPWSQIRLEIMGGVRNLLLDRLASKSLELRRWSTRAGDAELGNAAGNRARHTGAGLVTYSYCGFDSMEAYRAPAMLFQVHPHPETVRRILLQELAAHPECAVSLQQEWELALPAEDFDHLVQEPKMAHSFLAASSFTRESLVEHGVAPEAITVIPYGVDLEHFYPARERRFDPDSPLQLLFVGRINQRKGIQYLLEALRQFPPDQVRLTVCGRVVDNLELFRSFGDQVTIRPSVTEAELVFAYQQADLFVFPSVAEGFGQVLLEALACGLPILSTTSTAAPDLITEGNEGFIVEPRRPDLIADKITWCLDHRDELRAMSVRARLRAEHFTWERFRRAAAEAVRSYLVCTLRGF